MRVTKLLHKILGDSIHKKRINTLGEVLETVLHSKSLSVTRVGRRMKNAAQSRSNIRKVDRLYSNSKLLMERELIYSQISRFLVTSKRPLLSVDGSKLLNSDFYTLRVSLSVSGRGLTLYEKTYRGEKTGNCGLYRDFLDGLSRILPTGCKPILITDAEFRVPWFKLVLAHGWDFIGRVRGKKNINLLSKTTNFKPLEHYFKKTTSTPKSLGKARLNKQERSTLDGFLYLYKAKPKGRHAYTRSGCHSETQKSLRYATSAQEGWVLFSSMKASARKIIKAYKLRMTIEENFRDTKSGRYGLGLDMTHSKQERRYQIMLLIAMLAGFIAYLLGLVGESKNLQYKFQANSIKTKRVLSRFFLGCEMFYHGYKIIYEQLTQAIATIHFEGGWEEEIHEI